MGDAGQLIASAAQVYEEFFVPLADKLDDAQFERLAAEAETELQPFVTARGDVRFPHPALVLTATKT